MNTQFCTHTNDGSICDQCMGAPEGPEPWEKKWVSGDGFDHETAPGAEPVYLAAPVEAWAKEVKEWFTGFIEQNACNEGPTGYYKCNQCEMQTENGHATDCELAEAQRLLANCPVKEGKP